MREIIFGTTNKAKIDQINGALQGTDIVVIGIPDGTPKLEIVEDGKTAQENAHKKAVAYSKLLGQTVFAMDNALYFDGLSEDKQPGMKVRRFRNESRSGDTEMLAFYSDLIKNLGDEVDGHWEFGICLAQPNGSCKKMTIISPRKFVSTGSSNIVEGYPLESIQKDPVTDKIVSDMTTDEQTLFWQREIGEKLQKFMLESLN